MQVSPERFRSDALELVKNPENELVLSAASAWEIAIKYALGKLPLPEPPWEYVPSRMTTSGVQPLVVTHTHALHVATLPAVHRDPFDRLIIAQAQIEKIPILTSDQRFASYSVSVFWAG
jgi:PIN domain nuclease of toxin-antitoxin system